MEKKAAVVYSALAVGIMYNYQDDGMVFPLVLLFDTTPLSPQAFDAVILK
jgi:hypothetical protein